MSGVLVSRKDLKEALDFVKSVVPANPIMDADSNIVIEFKDSVVVLTATDGIQGARAKIKPLDVGDSREFSVGVDSKRLVKVVTKDTSENVFLDKREPYFYIQSEGEEDFTTLALANMRKASILLSWIPKEPLMSSTVNTKFFTEVLSFLDDFLPEGKDEGAKHAVVVLSDKVAHATNGINLRGICASGHLNFSSDVSLRKKYLVNSVRALKFLNCVNLKIRKGKSTISITDEEEKFLLVMPNHWKTPPVVPTEYLQPVSDFLTTDIKSSVKGIEKISSSNYNTATTLTGVDLILTGSKEQSNLKVVLEDNKASQTFPCERNFEEDLEKTLDLKTFLKMMKMFQKSKEVKISMGGADSRFVRFFDKRVIDEVPGAFIAVCAYARKI